MMPSGVSGMLRQDQVQRGAPAVVGRITLVAGHHLRERTQTLPLRKPRVVDERAGKAVEFRANNVQRHGSGIGMGGMSDRGCRDQPQGVDAMAEELTWLKDLELKLPSGLTMAASHGAISLWNDPRWMPITATRAAVPETNREGFAL